MKRIPHLLFAFLLAAIGAVQVNGATLAKENYTAYLFAYFTGNDPRQEQICFALSQDGYNYTPLNNGNHNRETCIDRMYFNEDGTIKCVIPTHKGINPVKVK